MEHIERTCRICAKPKDILLFRKGKGRGCPDGRTKECSDCLRKYFSGWYQKRKTAGEKVAYGLTRAKIIFYSSFNADKKKLRNHDLDVEFIESLIAEGCSYCLDTMAKMSIDRIDNSIGHVRTNVVASCVRCNWIRRDIPHDLWMLLVPVIREARISGLLDGWIPGTGNGTRTVMKIFREPKTMIGSSSTGRTLGSDPRGLEVRDLSPDPKV